MQAVIGGRIIIFLIFTNPVWNMDLSLFQVLNLVLVLTLFVLFIRYIIILYQERRVLPARWKEAKEAGAASAELRHLERRYRDKVRFHAWFLQIERLNREGIPGAFAELGVYRGESAEILHRMDPSRPMHLFDTFTGFPADDLVGETGEAATYTTSNFADTDIQEVAERIGSSELVRFYPGHFPGSAAGFSGPLALVNIDVDLYRPTRAGLELFYRHLSPGGVIFVHDYHHKWPGIIRAVDEFVAGIPEVPLFLPDLYGTVMIVRNR